MVKNGKKAEIDQVSARVGLGVWGNEDYFGPLIASAVYVDQLSELHLQDLGLSGNKKSSNNHVLWLANRIKKISKYSVVPVEPIRYNDLYILAGSLNRVLALAQAEALARVLEKGTCILAKAGQFVDEDLLITTSFSKGRKINLVKCQSREEDIAMVAASILAQAEYISWINDQFEKTLFPLPKGASDSSVISTGVSIVRFDGYPILIQLAKLHFKTTKEIQREFMRWIDDK